MQGLWWVGAGGMSTIVAQEKDSITHCVVEGILAGGISRSVTLQTESNFLVGMKLVEAWLAIQRFIDFIVGCFFSMNLVILLTSRRVLAGVFTWQPIVLEERK